MQIMKNKTMLCLIAGCSGSGKSSLSTKVKEFLNRNRSSDGHGHQNVVLFHQDHYFTKPFLPYNQRFNDSYENGDGIDWNRLKFDIQSFVATNASATIIVEGHMLGNAISIFQDLFKIFNILVVLTSCSMETCRKRRLERRHRTNQEKDDLNIYFDKYVWPSYEKYGMSAEQTLRDFVSSSSDVKEINDANLIEIDTDRLNLDESLDKICSKLNNLETYIKK